MDTDKRLRFGIFDFDVETRELRREGTLVRLQAQPAQVLELLLRNAGEVVSRESLRLAIWGTETFVDFDRGLNFCIAQIRSALGDSAEAPRFIRTFPRRGYQFVAPVSGAPGAELAPTPKTVSRRWPLSIAIAGFPLGALLVMGWNSWTARRDQPSTRVAVTRFDNQTGKLEFDNVAEALTDSITVELAGTGVGHFEVIGNAAILREPRAKRDLLAIAAALKANYIVLGQIQNAGAGALVLAHLIAVPEQTHVQVVRGEFSGKDTTQSEVTLARHVAAEFSKAVNDHRRARVRPPK